MNQLVDERSSTTPATRRSQKSGPGSLPSTGATVSQSNRKSLIKALDRIVDLSDQLANHPEGINSATRYAGLERLRSMAEEAARLLGEPATTRNVQPVPATAGATVDTVFLAATEARQKARITPLASILVIDDAESCRDVLTQMLEHEGYRVGSAETGEQGLAMAQTRCYDLILLDLVLPGVSGYEVLKQLKRDPVLRHLPVIILSGIDETQSTVRCIEIGAEDYLSKPFSPVLLRARIGASIEKKQLRDQEHSHLEQLRAEQQKSDTLLLNILPKPIAERLKTGESTIVDSFPDVTVMFADLADFTALSAHLSATEVWEMLNEIFSEFDQLAEYHGLEKIKTIGDAYMVVGGLPIPRADHARAVAAMALDMQSVVAQFNLRRKFNVRIRIGLNTGPVIAGIIGRKKFIYDLWGDTVNTASRMESQGQPGKIQITESTQKGIKDFFRLSSPEAIEIRGKGSMITYQVLGPITAARQTRSVRPSVRA